MVIGALVSLLVSVSFSYGDDRTVEVVGLGECSDCKESNIETSQAFSGVLFFSLMYIVHLFCFLFQS